MIAQFVGAVLLGLVIGCVWMLCAQRASACDLPEEPWLDWDGEEPEEFH